MQIVERDGTAESHVLAATVVNDVVCARIAAKWNPAEGGPFGSRWSNLVAGWAVKYHRRYGTAPAASIRGMFEQWAANGRADKDTVALVERFLAGLSDSYAAAPATTPEYVIDLAGRLFNRVALQRLREAIDGNLAGGDVDAAQAAVGAYQRG